MEKEFSSNMNSFNSIDSVIFGKENESSTPIVHMGINSFFIRNLLYRHIKKSFCRYYFINKPSLASLEIFDTLNSESEPINPSSIENVFYSYNSKPDYLHPWQVLESLSEMMKIFIRKAHCFHLEKILIQDHNQAEIFMKILQNNHFERIHLDIRIDKKTINYSKYIRELFL